MVLPAGAPRSPWLVVSGWWLVVGSVSGRLCVRAGRGSGLGELGVVDRHVMPRFLDLNREAPVDPRQRPTEGDLDAIHLAIIGVVDLRRVAANGRIGIAHLPQQQAGRLVEIKPHRRLALARADQCIGWTVADLIGMSHAE